MIYLGVLLTSFFRSRVIYIIAPALLAVALLAACAPSIGTPQPSPFPSQTPRPPSVTPTRTALPSATPSPSPTVTPSPSPTATVSIDQLDVINSANAGRLSPVQSFQGLQSNSGKSLAALRGSRYALVMTDSHLLVWDLVRRAAVRQVEASAPNFSHAWAYDEQNDRLWWEFGNALFSGPAASQAIDTSAQDAYASFFTGGCCELIEISPAGRLLVWFQHLALRVINLQNRASAVIYPPAGTQLQGFSPDGKLLYTYTDTGWLALYKANGGWLRSFPLGAGERIRFNGDSSVIIALSAENRLRLLDATTGASLRAVDLQLAGGGESGFVFSPELDLAAAMRASDGVENMILLWDLNTGALIAALPSACDTCALDALAFSPDGKLLLASYENGMVQAWGTTAEISPAQ